LLTLATGDEADFMAEEVVPWVGAVVKEPPARLGKEGWDLCLNVEKTQATM
jgi:hypothetical protein